MAVTEDTINNRVDDIEEGFTNLHTNVEKNLQNQVEKLSNIEAAVTNVTRIFLNLRIAS